MTTVVPCHETMNESLFTELLESLGFLVMERLSDATYKVLGQVPDWFTQVFHQYLLPQFTLVPDDLSPFIENFLPIAEQFWLECSSEIMKSGPWTETDASGTEHYLELSAVCLSHKNLLLLQILGRDYQEKQDLLQLCRDNSLDYEILFKTQQALRRAHELLLVKQKQLDEDMAAAAEIQRRFLPRDVPRKKGIQIASKFNPCMSIAGDMFNVVPLDEDHVAIYILDVSGHGAPAAMLAVSVCQMLQPHSGILMSRDAGEPLPTTILSPREVLEVLDGEFPIERFDKFFTIFYGVLNCHQGLLTYSNAGHPQPILLHPDGSMDFLDKGGTIIGMGGIIPFEQEERYLEEGDKIILYSDGVTELEDENNNQFGMERLRGLLNDSRKQSIATLLDTIHLSLMEYVGPVGPQDDLSLFGIEITGLWREKHERDAR